MSGGARWGSRPIVVLRLPRPQGAASASDAAVWRSACSLSCCQVHQWDRLTGSLLRSYTGRHSAAVTALCTDGDNFLFSASEDTTACLWRVDDGTCIRSFVGHLQAVTCCAVVGANFWTGSTDGRTRCWPLEGASPSAAPRLELASPRKGAQGRAEPRADQVTCDYNSLACKPAETPPVAAVQLSECTGDLVMEINSLREHSLSPLTGRGDHDPLIRLSAALDLGALAPLSSMSPIRASQLAPAAVNSPAPSALQIRCDPTAVGGVAVGVCGVV